MALTESAVRRSLILLIEQDSIYHKIPEFRIYQTFRFAEHKRASTVHKPEKKEKAVWQYSGNELEGMKIAGTHSIILLFMEKRFGQQPQI